MKLILVCICSTLMAISCCKVDLVVGLNVFYPNMKHESDLKVIVTDRASNLLIDSLEIGPLNETNNYSQFVRFNDYGTNNYIFVVDSTYADTIRNFSYETKGFNCNTRVGEVNYHHNGIPRNDMELIID